MPDPDDASLLREYCTSRSEAAFTQLVRRHLPLVFHAALRRLDSPALADEAAQNAFTRLAVKAAAVARHPARLRAWLHRTAFLEACTLARREARLSRLPLPPDSPAMHRPERYDRLDEALNALPELDRELILRRCCAGEDYRRIAAQVGKSEAACQKRVERGLLRLSESLGGAAAVTTIVAVFAAGSGKASVLPAAERIVSSALEKPAVGSAAGAWSGLAAACIAAALSGGVVGWRQARVVPSAPVARATPEPAARSASPVARAAMLPASAPFTGTLDDVLESIRAGRLGPLIDFLPNATTADLRTIVSEEDFSGLGEGSPPMKVAHSIAFRHWAETDPAGAFAYAVPRDRENTGRGMPRLSRAFAAWVPQDRAAATAALEALPVIEQRQLVASLHGAHDALADELVQRQPALLWELAIARYRDSTPNTDTPAAEQDDKLIAAILAGEREPGSTDRQVADVFTRLAFRNPQAALAQAEKIPAPGLREVVLQELRARFVSRLPAEQLEQMASTLPPGLDRTRATAALFKNLAASQPSEALRRLRTMPPGLERDAAFAQAGSVLAGAEPWAFLETLAALRGPVLSPVRDIHADGAHGALEGLDWYDNPVERALQFALQDDPARALKLMPEIVIRRGTEMSEKGVALTLANAWAAADLPAAIHWVATHGSPALRHDLRYELREYEPQDGGAQLLAMLTDAGEQARPLILAALGSTVQAAIFKDGGQSLLARLNPADADMLLQTQSSLLSVDNDFAGALALAAHATPEGRIKDLLPEIVEVWLMREHAGAIAWLQAQPPEIKRALLESVNRRHLAEPARAALEQITP